MNLRIRFLKNEVHSGQRGWEFLQPDYFQNTCLNAIKKHTAVAEMVCAYCILKFSVTWFNMI